MKKRKHPEEMAEVLRALGLTWVESNGGLHWRVKALGLDIWPTRWKTMRIGQVVTWSTMNDFRLWLGWLVGASIAPPERPLMSPRKRALRPFAMSVPVRVTGPGFSEEGWQDFRRSGLLPW